MAISKMEIGINFELLYRRPGQFGVVRRFGIEFPQGISGTLEVTR